MVIWTIDTSNRFVHYVNLKKNVKANERFRKPKIVAPKRAAKVGYSRFSRIILGLMGFF